MRILNAPVSTTLLSQGFNLEPQRTAKGMEMENVWWAKNVNDFYAHFMRACQDHTLAARIQVGASRDNQKNENWKCLMGKKT